MFNVYDTDSREFTEIYTAEELRDGVFNTIKYYKERLEEVEEKNKKLTDDGYTVVYEQLQNEIKNLQERLEFSYGFFSSQKEKDRYKQFEQRHMHNRLTNKYNGGRAPYLIPTATGIGTHLKVVCPICGESEDITDTEAW